MDEERKKIKKYFSISMDGLSVIVKVLDVKFSYGTWRYKVTPKAGKGEKWVQNINPLS